MKLFDIKPEDVEHGRKMRLWIRLVTAPVTKSAKAISYIYTQLKDYPLVVVNDTRKRRNRK